MAEVDRRMGGGPFCYSNEQYQNHCLSSVKFVNPGVGPNEAPPMRHTKPSLNKVGMINEIV